MKVLALFLHILFVLIWLIVRLLLLSTFGHVIDVLMVLAFIWWAIRPQHHLPHNRVRHQRIRLHLRLHPGRGQATLAELHLHWGRRAMFVHAKRARPDMSKWQLWRNPNEHSVRIAVAHFFHALRIRLEVHTLVMSPPRKGKTAALCRWILRYPGPVISTTVKADIFRYTSGIRQRKFGNVHVFNPQGIGDVPSTFTIDPVAGCENYAVAFRRATALCGATSTEKMKDGDWFKDKAAQLLAMLMYVAALCKLDFFSLASWALVDASFAQNKLANDFGKPDMAETLQELHNSPAEKTSATFKMILTQAFGFMNDEKLAECVMASRGEGFDMEKFVQSTDALYMIADADSDLSPMAPLFAMVLDEIKHTATKVGQRCPGGRLLRPLGMFLDEITQICPVPLDKWLASVGGLGIQIFAVVHGLAQLRKRWGDEGAQIIQDTSDVTILLPGIKDDKALDQMSGMIGDVSLKEKGREKAHYPHPIISKGMIRALPNSFGLIIQGNLAPVIGRMPKIWNCLEYRKAKAGGYAVAHVEPVKLARPVKKIADHLRDYVVDENGNAEEVRPEMVPAVNGNGHRQEDA